MANHKEEFIKIIDDISRSGFDRVTIFSDFCFMGAVAIYNSFTKDQKLEEDYLKTIKKYPKQHHNSFSKLLAIVTLALDEQYQDFLGVCFHTLEAHNKHTGQFFTPYNISSMIAKMIFSKEDVERHIKEKGYVAINEPACGAGGMAIAICEEARNQDINYQENCLLICQDLSFLAFYMTYIQLSLIGAPAIVIQGDTLKVEENIKWVTPFYYLKSWEFNSRQVKNIEDEIKEILNPVINEEEKQKIEIPNVVFQGKPKQLTLF